MEKIGLFSSGPLSFTIPLYNVDFIFLIVCKCSSNNNYLATHQFANGKSIKAEISKMNQSVYLHTRYKPMKQKKKKTRKNRRNQMPVQFSDEHQKIFQLANAQQYYLFAITPIRLNTLINSKVIYDKMLLFFSAIMP